MWSLSFPPMHSVLIFLSQYHLLFNLSVGRITHNIWFPTLPVLSTVEQFVSPGGRKKILKLWAEKRPFSFSSKEFWYVSIVLYYELYSTWFFINEVNLVQQVDAPAAVSSSALELKTQDNSRRGVKGLL